MQFILRGTKVLYLNSGEPLRISARTAASAMHKIPAASCCRFYTMKKEAKLYYQKKIDSFGDPSRIFRRVIPKDFSQIKKIHMSALCGTAMGSLAGMLKDRGFDLTGSDKACYSPMKEFIASHAIPLSLSFDVKHVQEADLTIIGNMLPVDNIEARYVREHSLPHISMAEAIEGIFLRDKKSIVVSGTHGKTTTTGLLAHIFSSAGKNPGYLIG